MARKAKKTSGIAAKTGGKLPSERVKELTHEEAVRLLRAGVTKGRSTEAKLAAIVRYLDEQYLER